MKTIRVSFPKPIRIARAIVLLILIGLSTQAESVAGSQLDNMSITLELPDIMFTCQRGTIFRVIIENNSDSSYKYWESASEMFSTPGWMRLDVDKTEGDALLGLGTYRSVRMKEWRKIWEDRFNLVKPGETVTKYYYVGSYVLNANAPGFGKVRLQVRDQQTGEMVTFNEEIVEVQKLEDTEREVIAEEAISEGRKLSIERVRTSKGSTQLIILPRKASGEVGGLVKALFGIPPESKIEFIRGKSQVHILAASSTGKEYYTRLAGVDTFWDEEYNDGKKRTLKRQPDGAVTLEVVDGGNDSAEESAESDPAASESLPKTNNVASIPENGTNNPTPEKSEPATSKQTDPKAGRSPFSVAIVASLAVLFLGIALFIVRRLSSRNSS